MTSPALTGDQLELFYVRGDSGSELFQVAHRDAPDETFSPGTDVTELNNLCSGLDKSEDLSFDGLRVYFSCYTDVAQLTVLRFAARPDRDSAFGSATELGETAPSAGLSADERELYGALFSLESSTQLSTRSSLSQPFGARMVWSSLDQVAFFSPTVSGDGLEIYGAVGEEKVFSRSTRARPTATFSAPTALTSLTGSLQAAGAPEISEDCRTLLYAGVDTDSRWAIYQAKR